MGILLKSALNRGGAKPNSNGMTLFYFIALFLKKRRNCLSSVTIRGGGSENCPNWQCHNVSGLPAPCYNRRKPNLYICWLTPHPFFVYGLMNQTPVPAFSLENLLWAGRRQIPSSIYCSPLAQSTQQACTPSAHQHTCTPHLLSPGCTFCTVTDWESQILNNWQRMKINIWTLTRSWFENPIGIGCTFLW